MILFIRKKITFFLKKGREFSVGSLIYKKGIDTVRKEISFAWKVLFKFPNKKALYITSAFQK